MLFFWIGNALGSSDVLFLTDTDNEFSAQGYISYLEDPNGSLTFRDISAGDVSQRFKKEKHAISMGYSDSTFWFKLPLKNAIANPTRQWASLRPNEEGYIDIAPNEVIPNTQWTLEIAYPIIDHITIYYETNNQAATRLTLGDTLAFKSRPVPISNFIIPFQLAPGESGTVYMRVQTKSAVRLPVTIRNLERSIEYYKDYQLGYGIYFGIICASFLYNLFMYLFLRDRSYLFYVSCIASFAMVITSVIGFGQDYLWRSAPWLTDYVIVESIALYGVFALLFSQSFLHTKHHTPLIHKLMSGLILLGLFLAALGLILPYNTAVRMAAIFSVCHTLIILTSGIIILLKGVREAKYFVLAWSTVLVGVSLFALLANGLVPANFFTHYSAQFGSAMEVILLSLALADRLRQLEFDKTKLELEARAALKRANKELSMALEQLKQSSRLKDEFLATISHELRTPMNGVEGAIELAKSERSPEKSIEHLNVAASSAKRMTYLVDTILEYSEIQAGKTSIELQHTDIYDFLESLSKEARTNCESKQITFTESIDSRIETTIRTDERALKLILTHLLDNAVKFTHKGGVKLNITLQEKSESDANIIFNICDTGIGIPEAAIDDIFNAFHQLDNSFSRGYGGLGIGLTICKELANKMDGALTVKRNSDAGTEFTLAIPYCPSEPVQAHPSTATPLPQKHSVEDNNILVVEDNLVNQKILCAILKKLGYAPLTANDGQEAIDLLNRINVKLIFMDCQMPNMDGFEATKKIRESSLAFKHTPIIAVTANAMSGDRKRCLDSGMDDYVKKPINKNIIANKLEQWLSSPRAADG